MSAEKFNPIISVENDGLPIPDVGIWAEEKYKQLGGYANLFTKSMEGKWDELVYIDLFASSGYSRIEGSQKLVMSSAFIALSLPFTKYIFCEQDEALLNALEFRAKRDFPTKKIVCINGDCNKCVDVIISHIPKHSPDKKVLSFCFLDP